MHTNESTHADAAPTWVNIDQEFTNAGATVTEIGNLDTPNAITLSGTPNTFTTAAGGPYDLVVVAAAYTAIDSTNWAVLNTAIAARTSNAFVLFIDSCCVASMVTQTLATFNQASSFAASLGSTINAVVPTILNTNSPYSSSFTGLNPFYGAYFSYWNNVPANNALYLASGSSMPIAGTLVNNVYAAFIPISQSYAGAGACLFAVTDISGLSSSLNVYSQNQGKIGPAFLKAIANGGACGLPSAITKTFAPTSIDPGSTSTLTISISNTGVGSIPGLNVTDTLPAPLVIAGAAATTCTGGTLTATTGANALSLTNGAIPADGCTITVPVQWPIASTCNTTVTNTITPGTDFTTAQGQVATPATATLQCPATPVLTIAKSAPNPGLQVGTASTYTLTVTNTGGAATTAGATILDALPTDLTLSSASGTDWTCDTTATPLSCTYGATLAAGGTASVLQIVLVPQASAAGATIVNYASVDPTGGNAPPTPGPACTPTADCAQSPPSTVAAAPIAMPVPVSSAAALAALALLLGALAWMRWRSSSAPVRGG